VAKISVAWGEAYAEWLGARAAAAKQNIEIHRPEPLSEDADEQIDQILDRIKAAEHRPFQAPVTMGWQLLQKFEVLQAIIMERERDGSPADSRHLMMLSSFHLDLMQFRFFGEGDNA
jgi:hypothetical protein